MQDARSIQLFWMNSEETKFVTVDDDFNLKLFYLPYILKCEMPMEFKKEWLGF